MCVFIEHDILSKLMIFICLYSDEEYQSNVSPTVSKIGADFQSLLDNTGDKNTSFDFNFSPNGRNVFHF